MPYTMLLEPEISPIKHLSLGRLQLTRSEPFFLLKAPSDGIGECILYPLIGTVDVVIDGDHHIGRLGARSDILDAPEAILRIPSCQKWQGQFTLVTPSADLLVITLHEKSKQSRTAEERPLWLSSGLPYLQNGGLTKQVVGHGTHHRTVYEYATPPTYGIHIGETLNAPGGWSSFPAHATPEVANDAYMLHEEVFMVFTNGFGIMHMDGKYSTGERAEGLHMVNNNDALVTPLGSHPIVASPGAWLKYIWAYRSTAITKTYNQFAHHVTTYVS